jgi:putative transposase
MIDPFNHQGRSLCNWDVRGTFRSVRDLIAKIENFVTHYNAKSRPVMWTATADSILEKFKGLLESIHGTRY